MTERDSFGEDEVISAGAVLDALSFPFYVADAHTGMIIFANGTARSAGLSEQAACFEPHRDPEGPRGAEDIRSAIEVIRKTRAPVVVEHSLRDAKGDLRTIETHGHPVFDSRGELERVIMYCFDVTERKISEEMLKRYDFIVNTAQEFMSLINRNYTYDAVNESYCLAQSRSRESFIGRTVAEVWGEERFSRIIRKHLDECFSGRESRSEAWFTFPS
ncbi:MAG: PAS domain-containing protein, partial [Chloroflexota bacterium]